MYVSAVYQGDIEKRLERSYKRLTSERYHLHKVVRNEGNGGWPGDYEGRTFLALVQLWNATGKKPEYFEKVASLLVEWVGEKGYFGRTPKAGESDEQQLAGNSWFFRSMCEWYRKTRDPRPLRVIENAARNLLLPLAPQYDKYPCRPEDRVFEGEAAGNLTGDMINGWYTSTDIGCAYILLDGATAVYEVLKTENPSLAGELLPVLEAMLRNYFKIDFLGISVQTHATLSGLRGVLRFARLENREDLVEGAKKIYALYLSQGMSENFENFNWFGRPSWTEPCAVIDSYFVAEQLYSLTGQPQYLHLMQWIYYNGMGYDQRPNGGFGCDSCVGEVTSMLSVSAPGLYEAYWCCTMRGADGLSYVAQTAAEEHQGVLTLRQLFAGRYKAQQLAFSVDTAYPADGALTFTLEKGALSCLQLAAVPLTGTFSAQKNGQSIPVRMANGLAVLETSLSAGDKVTVAFELVTEKVAPVSDTTPKSLYKMMRGPQVLGKRQAGKSSQWVPIGYSIDLTQEEALEDQLQVLFKE